MDHATMTMTSSGRFVIHRLALAMDNICTKFEISSSTRQEDRKHNAASRKWCIWGS